jgi:hypothetical protein
MIQQTYSVNTAILLTLQNPAGSGHLPTDATLLQNGAVVTSPTVTFTDLGSNGLYNATFTPTSTGIYVLYCWGIIQAQIEVVTALNSTTLQNIVDVSLGSWVWNKTAGTLQLLRQDGTTLANYTVVDNLTTASRELVI